MKPDMQRQWVVARRPSGRPVEDADFALVHAPVRAPRDGEVQLITHYLGFDPAQKSWMENLAGYMDPVEIGGIMPGWGVGVVAESRVPDLAPGDVVWGMIGWEERPTVPASSVWKL